MNQSMYLRRRNRIVLPAHLGGDGVPLNFVVTAVKNLEHLGFTFSEQLVEACKKLTTDQLVELYKEVAEYARKAKGAHRTHRPMYPNFPQQVMDMEACELYFNALIHYFSLGTLFPHSEKEERFPLIENYELTVIGLGSTDDFENLFTQIAGSNASLSVQDQEDLSWFVRSYGDAIGRLIPDMVPQKENAAYLATLLMNETSKENALGFVGKFTHTATDALRLVVALSGGDVSLAKATKIKSMPRSTRALILGLIDRASNATEDMLRRPEQWKRLAHSLHVGDYGQRFPRAAKAFDIIRNDKPFTTFNGDVERALSASDINLAMGKLSTRPGDYARRLDHILRVAGSTKGGKSHSSQMNLSALEDVADSFAKVASDVSTPVLLQVMHHFAVRNNGSAMRTFFPKGSLAKAQWLPNTLPSLPGEICGKVSVACEEALLERFSKLPSLGEVYVDTGLSDYLIPYGARSFSKALRSLPRGSRMAIPSHCNTIRFFCWWTGKDIDLSAMMFDADFNPTRQVSYTNLRSAGAVHSGDIIDAPNGASEFIDLDIPKMPKSGDRYVGMIVLVYNGPTFAQHSECFAGWMSREQAQHGEIYEPRTVQNRADLTAESKIAVPLLIDLVDRKVIWCDMGLKKHPLYVNNVQANEAGISGTLKALSNLDKPNLYELFYLHARARGKLVESPDKATTVFSVGSELPYKGELIASDYIVIRPGCQRSR